MAPIWVWQEDQAAAFFAEARRVLRSGGVMALPTETFYALAVNPFDPSALARLFALKGRPVGKPVLVLIAGPEMLFQVARGVPAAAPRLMARFWPGPLTLIFPARPDLPPLLTGDTGAIGLRQPRQEQVCRLLTALGLPLTGTSANRAGQEPLSAAPKVARVFGDGVDLILDVGPCPGGLPSSIVDLTVSPPRLVRAGAIAFTVIQEVLPDMRP
jgi:L-threonylcarbamoyladenylate synthase